MGEEDLAGDIAAILGLRAAVEDSAVVPATRKFTAQRGAPPVPKPGAWRNWLGNQEGAPEFVLCPSDTSAVVEVLEEARLAKAKVRVVGGSHSFSALASTDQRLIRMSGFRRTNLEVNAKRVEVGAGLTVGELSQFLLDHGWALPTSTVIPHVELGGVLATASHGTGKQWMTMSDLVEQLEVVFPNKWGVCILKEGGAFKNSKPVQLHRPNGTPLTSDEVNLLFRALLSNLGSLGVVTRLWVKCEPQFRLHAVDDLLTTYMDTAFATPADFKTVLDGSSYVEVIWFPHTERLWVKAWERTTAPLSKKTASFALDELATVFDRPSLCTLVNRSPELTPWLSTAMAAAVPSQDYVANAQPVFHFQTTYPKVWDMSYAFDAARSSKQPFEQAWKAWWKAVDRLRAANDDHPPRFPQNMAIHLRYIAGSKALLSPSRGHDGSVILELVTLKCTDNSWEEYFRDVEADWLDLGGRPHLGKVFGWPGENDTHRTQFGRGFAAPARRMTKIQGVFGQKPLKDFAEVRSWCDPLGLFDNPLVGELLK